MISFTWNDYIKIGYNEKWFVKRENVNDVFSFSFSPSRRKNYGLNEEAIITAAILDELVGVDNISILYSGGIDSEFIAKSFLLYKKTPQLVFLKFNNGLNEYDFYKAQAFANVSGLKLQVIEFDLIGLHNSGRALELCKKYQSSEVGYAPYLATIEELSKTQYLILGDDPVFELVGLEGEKTWNYCLREHTFSWWKAFFMNDTVGCPSFMNFSPDLLYAYMSTRRMEHLFSQTALTNSTYVKSDIFRESMSIKSRHKMSGTEKILGSIFRANTQIYRDHDLSIPDTKYIPINDIKAAFDGNTRTY